jgi:hypothetical protein
MTERLGWSVELARALGREKQADEWMHTVVRMRDAFRKYHLIRSVVREGQTIGVHVADVYDPGKPDAPRGYSQAGQTIAITSGLLTDKEAAADLTYAFPAPDGSPPPGVTRWNNPTYGYRVLRALTAAGMADRAVAHLLERYGPYLPAHPRNPTPPEFQGPFGGPLPEYWVSREDLGLSAGQINTAQPADETGSHGWGSVPLLWLHDSLLGVRITKPGGGELRIAPCDGGLPYVAGHTMTPKGPVWVHWDPRARRLEVSIPAGVTAEVACPNDTRERPARVVAAEGKAERKSGKYAHPPFEITGAGRYVFQGR